MKTPKYGSLNPYSTGIRIEEYGLLFFVVCICLNPYSTGIRIEDNIDLRVAAPVECLNPYSTGIRIEGFAFGLSRMEELVLILILLEYE